MSGAVPTPARTPDVDAFAVPARSGPPRSRYPAPDRGKARRLVVGLSVGVVLLVAAIIAVSVLAGGFARTAGGEVAVVRNGGPLDNNRVRQVLPQASARTWIGIGSTVHTYPAQQRFYTITSDTTRGDRAGFDVENDPTADGVEVGIEATVYFTLNTETAALERFDNTYGTRKYRGLTGAYRYAWEGDEGWTTFLDQVVRPVISNDLRQEIGDFRCAELQASCALVQNTATATTVSAAKSNVNIGKIQQAINASLAEDLTATLGGDFITGVRFSLAKITLPQKVQDAINQAQAAFAGVTEAQARVAQATADAKANEERQRGYSTCPACALIDEYKAIPPTITTFAPGAGFAVTPSAAH